MIYNRREKCKDASRGLVTNLKILVIRLGAVLGNNISMKSAKI